MSDRVSLGRWVVKKAGRRAFALARRPPAARAARVRALVYHRIRVAPRDPFSVSPAAFEAQMAWLAQHGLAVSLDAVADFLAGRASVPPGAVLVTIDDGFRDAYDTALPILARHRIPACLFVVVGSVEERDGPPPPDRSAEAHVSWGELRSLELGGVSVGSHAWDHVPLARLGAPEVARQARRSRDVLRERLGAAVPHFAYPFGTRGSFDDGTRRALADAGYACAFTAQHGAIAPGMDPLALPRIKVEGGEGMWMFRRLLAGGLDDWSLIDQLLWRLQAAEPATPATGAA
jgi:peptidoglycan/xylan/chitin deacetylase (PgdA/CDA1 family)